MPFNFRGGEKIPVREFTGGIPNQDGAQSRRRRGISEPGVGQHIFGRARPDGHAYSCAPAQKLHLRREEGVGYLSSTKPRPQPGRSVRNGRPKTVASRQAAQLVEPIPQIQAELFERISAIGDGAGAPWPEVVAIVHGKKAFKGGKPQAASPGRMWSLPEVRCQGSTGR
jgi:hypothetical protein